MTPEKKFENKIKNYLEEIGAWFIKYWAGAKFTKEGIPDLLTCINGKFVAIEVKAENGKPTLIQIVILRQIRNAGGIGVLLYPKDFNYFIDLMEGKEIGKAWYRENIKSQNEWFNKLNA
jgi:hypothetical protein